MVKPMRNLLEGTPTIQNEETKRWYQRAKGRTGSMKSGRSTVNITSPGGYSVTSLDRDLVHEQHIQQRKDDLADLYSVVYGDEDRKNASATDVHAPEPPRYDRGQPLPRLAIERPELRRVQTGETYPQSPMSPVTPRSPSVRAIHPPNMTSPVRDEFPPVSRSPVPGLPKSPRDGRTASFSSNKSASSPQKARKALRDIKISNPIQRFRADDNDDGAMTPLSPRAFEEPGEVPPFTGRTNDSQYPPTTPGTGRSFPYPEEARDDIADLPQPYPQRIGSYQYDNPAQAVTDAASIRPDPTGTTQQNKRGHGRKADDLPFRKFAHQRQPPVAQEPFPLSPSASWNAGLRSPGQMSAGLRSPAIRENVLEYHKQNLKVPTAGQLTGQLTGVKSPYSPYMPDELITPVFQTLPTPARLKQKEREQKAARGAATEKDQVADEADLWSSGY